MTLCSAGTLRDVLGNSSCTRQHCIHDSVPFLALLLVNGSHMDTLGMAIKGGTWGCKGGHKCSLQCGWEWRMPCLGD